MAIAEETGSSFEESESYELTAANQQPVTLDQFLLLLDLNTKYLMSEIRKYWRLPSKKDTFEDTMSQSLNDTVCLTGQLKAENQIPLQESVENGKEDFKYGKESLKDLKPFNLKEILPEILTQQKGKYLKRLGTFKIKKKIGNGTLQFLYKNGFFNLSKESCVAFKHQDIDDIQHQLETQVSVLWDAAGGVKLRKKFRKRVKKKKKKEKRKKMVMKI